MSSLVTICIFGLLASAILAGITLLFIGSLAGIVGLFAELSRPILDLKSEDFFRENVPKLLRWNVNAFDDFSSLIVCKAGRNLQQIRVIGTLKSFHNPEARGWIAFDLSKYMGQGGRLCLRTSEHELEFAWRFSLSGIHGDFFLHQQLVGKLHRRAGRITISDDNGQEIGSCQFPTRMIVNWQPLYGDLCLRGKNIGRMNGNLWSVTYNVLGLRS